MLENPALLVGGFGDVTPTPEANAGTNTVFDDTLEGKIFGSECQVSSRLSSFSRSTKAQAVSSRRHAGA